MAIDKKGKLTYIELLKEDLCIFRVVPEDKIIPDFKTGQFLTLGMPIPTENNKIVRRAYSLASHPENKKYYEFVIRWVRKPLPGRVTTALFNAGVGDEVSFIPPTGNALIISDTLPNGEPDNRRIVCLGGGTGIAPFLAFARHMHDVGDKRELIVLHGSSYVDELSFKNEFTSLEIESEERGRDRWNFRYAAAVSRPQEWFNRSWKGQTGRVETFLRPKTNGLSPLEEMVGEKVTPENTIFYVCGWQGTVDGCMDFLRPAGFRVEKEKDEDGNFSVKFESYG